MLQLPLEEEQALSRVFVLDPFHALQVDFDARPLLADDENALGAGTGIPHFVVDVRTRFREVGDDEGIFPMRINLLF